MKSNKRDSLKELNKIICEHEGTYTVSAKLSALPLSNLKEFIDTLKSREEIDAVYRTSHTLLNEGEVKRAKFIFESCIEAADRINYAYGKAWAYAGLGSVFTTPNPKEAIANHKIALNIFDELENNSGIARVCTDMAMDYKALDDFDMTFKLLNKAMKYHEKLNEWNNVGNCCWRIGTTYLYMSAPDEKDYKKHEKKAITYLKRAEKMYEKTGNAVERARVMRNFADISLENGDFKKARGIYKNALKLDKGKNRTGEAFDIEGIAETYLMEEDFDKAFDFVDRAIELYDNLNYIPDKCSLCLFTAEWCHGAGRTDDARHYLQEAEDGYKRIEDKEGLARTYFMLGTVCLIDDDLKSSMKYADMAVKMDPGIMKKMMKEARETLLNKKK